MKFYLLLVIIGVAIASDISADNNSEEDHDPLDDAAKVITIPQNGEKQVIYYFQEEDVYRIVDRDNNKNKTPELVSTAKQRKEIVDGFYRIATRIEELLEDSDLPLFEKWGKWNREFNRQPFTDEILELLRPIYPFLEGGRIVDHVKHREARHIRHEKPHHGHQGHHQGHRPNHH